MSLRTSASQTVGPYFRLGMSWLYRNELGLEASGGERVRISGVVYDGDAAPIPDALIEVWQADARGQFAGAGLPPPAAEFLGFGRIPSNERGAFELSTIKPGRVPGPGGTLQAPHLAILILARGLLKPLYTRLYFPDEAANDSDPVLQLVPAARRHTLIARPAVGGRLEWDIRLQGERETVFMQF